MTALLSEDALGLVEAEVRELIRRRGLDPVLELERTRELVDAAVRDYDQRSARGVLPALADLDAARRVLLDLVAGFGPLQPLLDDPRIEEIWINGPAEVYAARGGESELTSLVLTEAQIRNLVERMLKSSGRRLDLSSPFVDAALPDGSRLHVVIPDVTRRHWAVNIRKFVARARRLDDLVLAEDLIERLRRAAALAVGGRALVIGLLASVVGLWVTRLAGSKTRKTGAGCELVPNPRPRPARRPRSR